MNFIVGRLLLIIDNEEQTFWLFIQIIENILPLMFYSDLAGVVIETTIIDCLISVYLKDFYNFLMKNSFKLTLSNFIHKWMVGLFTQSLSPEMVYTFFDFFFLDGFPCIIKNSICLMSMIENEIKKNNDFEYLYNMFNEAPSHFHDPKTMIYFLNEKKYEISLLDIAIYRYKIKIPVINKLKEDILDTYPKRIQRRKNSLKKKNIHCNPNWPACLYDNYTHLIVDSLIFKENRGPFMINDYYYVKNDGEERNKNDNYEEFTGVGVKNDVLVERHKHICDDIKLVESSQNLIEDYKKINDDFIFDKNKKFEEENKIYGELDEIKDFDILIQEIKKDMSTKDKEINVNEIKSMMEKNMEGEKYYNRDYSFYVPE